MKMMSRDFLKNLTLSLFSMSLLSLGAFAQNAVFAVQKTPSPNARGNTLNAVAAVSATDAWAVGYQNDNNLNDSRSLIQHWNGSSWATVKSPNPGTTQQCQGGNTGNVLNAVAAVASNDAWAVGVSFTCSSLLKPTLERHAMECCIHTEAQHQ